MSTPREPNNSMQVTALSAAADVERWAARKRGKEIKPVDQVWATVVAGIGSATIAGVIGIISATVSYRMSSRQLDAQLNENEHNREHEIRIAIGAKKREALESLWRLLFILERSGHLDDADLDLYIRGLMWLSPDLRKDCLSIVRDRDGAPTAEQEEVQRKLIASIRESILRDANDIG